MDEHHIEAGVRCVELQRLGMISRIRDELAGPGEDVCISCDEPIGAARKAAMPSAERCIDCQAAHERGPR